MGAEANRCAGTGPPGLCRVGGGRRGAGGTALTGLAERGGFLPRPDAFDESLKPGFRGGRALLAFFLCNAVPFGAALYYLREQRTQRAQLAMTALPSAPDEVASEALRVVRTASDCFLVQAGGAPGALRIDPHGPEGSAYVPPSGPLPLLPQMERNAVTDILESPHVPGLKFVHFAVSRGSAAAAPLMAGDRRASLLYVSGTRGAYCTVSGQLSVLDDVESRRRYWRSPWAAAFLPGEAEPAGPGQEAAPPWLHRDYLLLRLSIGEVSLQATVDGPQRWEQRRVRRCDGRTGEEPGAEWATIAP